MKIKVCGLFEPSNIIKVSDLKPDYIGFIFYPQSPRFSQIESIVCVRSRIDSSIKPVGVFVDEDPNVILRIINEISLSGVQLHGIASSKTAEALRDKGFKGEIFLATTVENLKELENISNIDYLIFDTPSPFYGGSGVSFDWSKLTDYAGDTPFFLSGGIGDHNIKDAISFEHSKLVGIDVNSRLESEDRTKDISKVLYCVEQVRSYEGR